MLRKEKAVQGKAFVYEATAKPGTVYRSLVGGMLDRVFGGNAGTLVAHLLKNEDVSQKEIDEIRRLIDRLGKK